MFPNKKTDFKVNIRIKLSALWTSLMFCYIYGDYFELYVPGKVVGLVNGHNMLDHPFKLLAASFMLVVPALMIFLCLQLPPVLCRILNLIFGIFFTALMLLIGISSLTSWLIFYVFLAGVECILTSIIVLQAWKWQE